ncbi:MAG: 50S ribosomal protein L3 [Myxococcota bacterium]
MSLELLCRKVGMTQIYSDSGECIPVTVLEAGGNTVIQKKAGDKEGYDALQIGFGERRPANTPKPLAGHYQKAGVAPKRHLRESRVSEEVAAGYEVGQEVGTDIFSEGQRVDVVGVSKGRGTAGVVKRHKFAVKRRTHGTHEYFRHAGAIGAGAWPSRVLKGKKMPGRYGNARSTTLNQEIVRIDADRHLLFIRGAVAGHKNGIVRVRPSDRVRS